MINHVLVRIAALQTGHPNFRDYLVLGDDVVIAGKDVAVRYLELIKNLGVKVSPTKSVFPSRLLGLEFASKLIRKDGNISPLPIGLLKIGLGLGARLEFLAQLVDRAVNPGDHHARYSEAFLESVLGRIQGRPREKFRSIFAEFFLLRCYIRLREDQLRSGQVPKALTDLIDIVSEDPDHPFAYLVTFHES
jgi:hypothetical protein